MKEIMTPYFSSEQWKGEMLAISNCMVIGDRRKFLAMVISLKTVMDTETGASTDNLAPDSLHVGKQVVGYEIKMQLVVCIYLFTLDCFPASISHIFARNTEYFYPLQFRYEFAAYIQTHYFSLTPSFTLPLFLLCITILHRLVQQPRNCPKLRRILFGSNT